MGSDTVCVAMDRIQHAEQEFPALDFPEPDSGVNPRVSLVAVCAGGHEIMLQWHPGPFGAKMNVGTSIGILHAPESNQQGGWD